MGGAALKTTDVKIGESKIPSEKALGENPAVVVRPIIGIGSPNKPFAVGGKGDSYKMDSRVAAFGNHASPPGVKHFGETAKPEMTSLIPVSEMDSLAAASAPQGFWSRLWNGAARLFGSSRSFNAMEEGADLMSARRAINLDTSTAPDPNFSLSNPNPFTRVKQKMEIDMPGSESLESFLGRMSAAVPEVNRAEAKSILSLLTDPAAGSGTTAVNLRLEVAAEIHGSGQGYLNRYQIADAVKTVLARHGLDANALETALGASGREALSSVMQNLSLHLLPDDVPLYRTSGRGVREGATTATMRGNLDGMTYWGVGSDGIATAEEYLSDGRALVTTTVGELRRYGALTTDDIAKAGNAVEFYHEPRDSGGWVSVPVRVVNRSVNAGPKSPDLL